MVARRPAAGKGQRTANGPDDGIGLRNRGHDVDFRIGSQCSPRTVMSGAMGGRVVSNISRTP